MTTEQAQQGTTNDDTEATADMSRVRPPLDQDVALRQLRAQRDYIATLHDQLEETREQRDEARAQYDEMRRRRTRWQRRCLSEQRILILEEAYGPEKLEMALNMLCQELTQLEH